MIDNKYAMEVDLNNELSCTQSGGLQNSENLVELCRLCAVASDHLIPIFDGEGLQHNLSDKVNKYLPVNVTENDTLPQQLCYHCAATILAYHEISEGCLHAQKKLLQIQKKINSRQGEENIVPIDEFQETKGKDIPTNSLTDQDQIISDESFNNKDKKDEDLNSSDRNRCAVIRSRNTETSLAHESRSKASHSAKQSDLYDFDETRDIQQSQDIGNKEVQSIKNEESYKTESNVQKGEEEHESDEKQINQSVKRKKLTKNKRTRFESYPCMYCEFIAKQKKLLSKHMTKDHPDFPLDEQIKKPSRADKELIKKARVEANGRVYYICKECDKILFSPYTFYCHTRIHTGEKPFTCHLCGKQFRIKQGLVRHLNETHAGIKNFPCDICTRTFATKRILDDHRRTHTGERPYVCNTCGKTFKQKASLFVHNRSHTNFFPFECIHCNQVFRTRPLLMLHITKHTGEKPHICDVCQRPFRIKYELKRHKLIHSDEKPWQCSNCDLSFRQKRYLIKHIKNHHKDIMPSTSDFQEVQQVVSTLEGKQFNVIRRTFSFDVVNAKEKLKVNLLKKDNTHKHGEFKNSTQGVGDILEKSTNKNKKLNTFHCSACNKIFREKKNYKIHLKSHAEERRFTCHICGKQFSLTGSLYYHLKHVHEGVKNHACDICGRSFAMKKVMEDHRRIHTGERPYVCDSCGKTFKTKAALYIHSKTHSDQYPFKCTYCKKGFRWRQQLQDHTTVHTGEKKHTCEVCGKCFGVKYGLTRHKRIHSTEKPFICEKCGCSFAQKRYLRSHELIKHKT